MPEEKKCVIEAKGLGKKYGKFTALENVSFIIDEPTVLGMVGKNGSGKSTFMRILNGWEKPSFGALTVNGRAPFDCDKVLRNMLFIDEKIDFDYMLTLGGVLEKCAFMDERFDLDAAHDMAEQFGLDLRKRFSQCSKGMKSQFGVVLGLAFNRPITLMDEPISGMDEISRRLFYKLLTKAQSENPRIFMVSTHLLGEFEQYCDSFMVLNKGKLVAYDGRETFETLYVRVSGLEENVNKVIEGLETYEQKRFASMINVTVPDLISREKRKFAEENNVDIKRVGVNDACVILGGLT